MKNHFVTKARGSHITVSRGPAVINGGDGSTLCPIQGRRLIACAIRLIHCPNDGVSAPLDTGWSGGPGAQPERPPDTLTPPTPSLNPRPSIPDPPPLYRPNTIELARPPPPWWFLCLYSRLSVCTAAAAAAANVCRFHF